MHIYISLNIYIYIHIHIYIYTYISDFGHHVASLGRVLQPPRGGLVLPSVPARWRIKVNHTRPAHLSSQQTTTACAKVPRHRAPQSSQPQRQAPPTAQTMPPQQQEAPRHRVPLALLQPLSTTSTTQPQNSPNGTLKSTTLTRKNTNTCGRATAEPGRSSHAIWYTFMTPNNIAWAKSARRKRRHRTGVKSP